MILRHTRTMTKKKKHFLKLERTTKTIMILSDSSVLNVLDLSPGSGLLQLLISYLNSGTKQHCPLLQTSAQPHLLDGPRL